MKKSFGLTLLAFGMLLAGCGNEKISTTNQAQEETKGTTGEGANSSQPQEELKAKIVDQVSYVFTDPYAETTTASYFAVVQNKVRFSRYYRNDRNILDKREQSLQQKNLLLFGHLHKF
ncbi:hypothetical protein F6Y02_36530 [Bacillus megaterium]|nr:hypothetical protein [Priestia megaterium]